MCPLVCYDGSNQVNNFEVTQDKGVIVVPECKKRKNDSICQNNSVVWIMFVDYELFGDL